MDKIEKKLWHVKLFELKKIFSINVDCETEQQAENIIRKLHAEGKLEGVDPQPKQYVIMVGPVSLIMGPKLKIPSNGGQKKK